MVSIIISCYNGKKFVERCLNSLLCQTYKDLEVIIVNDGSTDNSENMIKTFEPKFKEYKMKLIYIYQKNMGSGGAINTGLKYVTREYLTLLDIDDYLMPDSIELKVRFLEEHKDFNIVRTNGYYVSEYNLDDETRLFVTSENEKKKVYIFNDLIEAKTNNWAGSYMIRVKKLFEFYQDREIHVSRYGQNLQLLLPLAYEGKSGFIDKPLMKYIRQEKSLSQSPNNINYEIDNMLGYKNIRKYMIELILKGEECTRYLEILEIVYARYFMYLAIQYKNLELIEKNYLILKELSSLNINDRITYYNLKNKPLSIMLRILRKALR